MNMVQEYIRNAPGMLQEYCGNAAGILYESLGLLHEYYGNAAGTLGILQEEYRNVVQILYEYY